ncbi:hypothetical protein C2S51_020989 [Perilla frutescens var. frutescens]|nr:hypothetical protein C2S51_020989 [Perilla frutescens var. frutescens]
MDRKKHTANYDLPQDIIKNILSRLPVKSLVRFKGVCKQWKDTISDPKFAEIHLQQSKKSSRSYLVESQKANAFKRVVIQNNEFEERSALKYPPALDYSESSALCHCDGLFLISRNRDWHTEYYVLWNPSSRTYKQLHYPYPVDCNPLLRSGICYDPLVKYYKVVLGDAEHYVVFCCKRNSWSETREMNNACPVSDDDSEGVPFNGSIYWISCSGLLCFNGRDETFKDLRNIRDCSADEAYLISSGNSLYIFTVYQPFSLRNEIVIMKRDGDDQAMAWMEFKVKLPFPYLYLKPLCSTQENYKIIVKAFPGINHLLYDDSKRCFVEILNSSGLGCSRLFPYLENLFLL